MKYFAKFLNFNVFLIFLCEFPALPWVIEIALFLGSGSLFQYKTSGSLQII